MPYGSSSTTWHTASLLEKGQYGKAVHSLRDRREHQAILLGDLEYFKRNSSHLTDAMFSGPTLGGYEPCLILHFAVYSGNLEMVKLVMELEEEPFLFNENDARLKTPIQLAERLGHKEIAL